MNENLIWEIRAYIYQHFAETTRPPLVEETASRFGLTHEQAAAAYEELQRRHAILLQPGTHDIQMAWPFSGVETPFHVHADDKTYFANCAWDSLGIPAADQTRWCISSFPFRAGMTIFHLPEGPCCSSGRKNCWSNGWSQNS
jgi:hypothetical protein